MVFHLKKSALFNPGLILLPVFGIMALKDA